MAGFYAPVVADESSADRIVLLAAMIPNPGERGHNWWAHTDHPTAQRTHFEELGLDPDDLNNPDVVHGHDIPGGHLPALSRPQAVADILLSVVS